jgi:hypothetical protein
MPEAETLSQVACWGALPTWCNTIPVHSRGCVLEVCRSRQHDRQATRILRRNDDVVLDLVHSRGRPGDALGFVALDP